MHPRPIVEFLTVGEAPTVCSENDEKWHFVSNHSDYLHSKKNSYHLQLPPHFCLHGTDKPISEADKKAIG